MNRLSLIIASSLVAGWIVFLPQPDQGASFVPVSGKTRSLAKPGPVMHPACRAPHAGKSFKVPDPVVKAGSPA
jgi:hypothetical protein